MKLKRVAAYIIDILIISVIANLIFSIPVFEHNSNAYLEANKEMTEYIQKADTTLDMKKLNEITYKVVYASRYLSIIEIALTILYFGVLQFILDGQTIGKKLLKIKIKPEKGKSLNSGLFMLRTIILHNVIFDIISTVSVITLNQNLALKINSYSSYGALLVELIIIGTIIFRDDERGLHDLIANTKVVPLKEEN